jgi:hypothetical protein
MQLRLKAMRGRPRKRFAQNQVERVVLNGLANVTAALPPDIYIFGGPIYHRSEPDWHFQEKPIHNSAQVERVVLNALAV